MNKISIRTGLWMFASLVAFFLLMYCLGLGFHSELRIFSAVIILLFMYRDIRIFYLKNPESIDNYMSGVTQGMGAAAIGVVGFTIFMTLFLWMNPAFLDTLRQTSSVGEYLGPFTASLIILVEGLVVALIGAYILTRILIMRIKKQEV